ncbi:MAG: hypothetical protein Q7J54_04995 [Candidatus Woesearchaeota archaeon]|nr:hypothetical protein [Candidatus Woesearchaeota archaeon]
MQIQEQKKELEENIIPQIEQRRKLAEEKQEAVVYESLEGMKSAFNLILETLNKGEEYLVFTLGEELKLKETIIFFQNFHKKRIEKGIKARLISNIKLKDTLLEHHKHPGMRFRFTEQSIPIGIFIFNGNVMTVVWHEKPTAFIIHSKQNYEYYREFFEDMWKNAMP